MRVQHAIMSLYGNDSYAALRQGILHSICLQLRKSSLVIYVKGYFVVQKQWKNIKEVKIRISTDIFTLCAGEGMDAGDEGRDGSVEGGEKGER